MCDYSLYVFPNRLARDGEELVSYRFSTGCTGFVGADDFSEAKGMKTWMGMGPQLQSWFLPRRHNGPTAVCIPPGAAVRMHTVERTLRQRLGLAEREDAVFIQVTADEFAYRDGLRFGNGRQILLQELGTGQRVRVRYVNGATLPPDKTQREEAWV